MSYTCYYFASAANGADPGIERVRIRVDGGSGQNFYYDDADFVTSFNEEVSFNALAAEGYDFYRYVYRTGSLSAAQQYTTEDPFYYDGSEGDIYIRAESVERGSISDEWTVLLDSFGTISTETRKYALLDTYTLNRYDVQFASSGTATFYTTGDADTIGWVGTSTTWNESTGKPSSYLASNDDNGDDPNCRITLDVEAGTTYYFWVRLYDGTASEHAYIYIDPPAQVRGNGQWYVYSGGWKKVTPYIYKGGWQQADPYIY